MRCRDPQGFWAEMEKTAQIWETVYGARQEAGPDQSHIDKVYNTADLWDDTASVLRRSLEEVAHPGRAVLAVL